MRGALAGAYYRYTPCGEVDRTDETDTTRSELGYTNALRLSGGLIHLVNRAYDTEAKVFVQADVVDRLRYAYTGGDPINRSDPTGLRWAQNTNDMPMAERLPGEGSGAPAPQPEKDGGAVAAGDTKDALSTEPPVAETEPARAADEGAGTAAESGEIQEKSQPAEAEGDAARDGKHMIDDSAMVDDAAYQDQKAGCLANAPCAGLWQQVDGGPYPVVIVPKVYSSDIEEGRRGSSASPIDAAGVTTSQAVDASRNTDPEKGQVGAGTRIEYYSGPGVSGGDPGKKWYQPYHELHHARRNQQGVSKRSDTQDHREMDQLRDRVREAAGGKPVP